MVVDLFKNKSANIISEVSIIANGVEPTLNGHSNFNFIARFSFGNISDIPAYNFLIEGFSPSPHFKITYKPFYLRKTPLTKDEPIDFELEMQANLKMDVGDNASEVCRRFLLLNNAYLLKISYLSADGKPYEKNIKGKLLGA
jgi:hypothetical protein